MRIITGLIYAAVFVYIAVALTPGLNTTLATITTPTYSTGVAGMFGVILIVFAAMIIKGILGASEL
jgi:Na+/H+ antiporter NhaC